MTNQVALVQNENQGHFGDDHRRKRQRLLGTGFVVAVSAVGFLMMLGYDTAATAFESSSSDYLQPGSPSGAVSARLHYETAEGPIALANGESVAIDGGLVVAATVSPYPPTSFDATVDLLVTTADGTPVTDATVSTVWDMVVMWHGPFTTDFTNLGEGHYSADFDLFMFGPWQLATQIESLDAAKTGEIVLSIYVWPE